MYSGIYRFIYLRKRRVDKRSAENTISNSDGMLLLCFFAIFLGYTFAIAHNGNGEEETKIKLMPVWKSGVFIAGGLAGLIYGGQFFVDGASGIARGLGVSESIIGLTLVAGGTSCPNSPPRSLPP